MGHLVGKEVLYRELGKKIDGLTVRAPWNENFHAILKELYTVEEADLIVKMPYRLSDLKRIRKVTKIEETKLRKLLDGLCAKGLMMDIDIKGDYYYMISPLVIGIFEFTMMRTGGNLNSKEWAKLFNSYMSGENSVLSANCVEGDRVSILRALPHEGTVAEQDFVEVLDYEKASQIIGSASSFSLGLCSCRHEKYHLEEKKCDIPLETCASFDMGADFLIRNKLARKVSKTEMLEHLARSREAGLVLSADNVKKNITAICSCCCNVLLGITKHGLNGLLVTSNFIAQSDAAACSGCGKCAKACPVNAIEMLPVDNPAAKIKKQAKINTEICIGCGVCALQCVKTQSLKLIKREKRVLHPENVFEKLILQCLEKGTLQNQLFDNPQSMTHNVMRNIMGGFYRLPMVKKSLMSDALRSTFLKSMTIGVKLQGVKIPGID